VIQVLVALLCVLPTVVSAYPFDPEDVPTPRDRLADFSRYLDQLRTDLGIPGMGAAMVYRGRLVYSQGFGYADVERKIESTPHTPFHIASVTKTFAAVAVLQLVEQGKIDLDAPASQYGLALPPAVRVRHLLSHTSQGVPGEQFLYDGMRYGLLGDIVRQVSGQDLEAYWVEHVFVPLGLTRTAFANGKVYAGNDLSMEAVYADVADPYRTTWRGKIEPTHYQGYTGASAGIVASVEDLARYAAALQRNELLKPETQQRMWTAQTNRAGQVLPYGLGWFVQEYAGLRVVYHYGIWDGCSSLLMLVPEAELAFVVLANSERLSSAFDFTGDRRLLSSSFALAFLHRFVLGKGKLAPLEIYASQPELLKQLAKAKAEPAGQPYALELAMQAAAYRRVGRAELAERWYGDFQLSYARRISPVLKKQRVLAAISGVQNDTSRVVTFSLTSRQRVRLLAVGESAAMQMRDYAWLVRTDSAQARTPPPLWEMKFAQTEHAGGADKNRMQQLELSLEAGTYALHYRTDESHAWLQWNDLPPLLDFYGVVVYVANSPVLASKAAP
jgi:CubicO group peptidase (beta-lactamase class C family)